MTHTITERGWRCLNLGCPTREPVRAAEPPKCYTCDRAMAEAHYPVTEKEIGRLAAAIDAGTFSGPALLTKWLPEPLARRRAEREVVAAKDGRAFPCGYDVVGEEVGRVSYSAEQPPLRATSVGIDDRGRLSVRIARRELERLQTGVRHPVSVGYEVTTEHAYRCTRAGCPTRELVQASSPPTCYTCSQPMSEVAEFVRPASPDPGIAAKIEFLQRQLVNAAAIPATLLLGPAGLGARASLRPAACGTYDRTGWRAEYLQRPMPRSRGAWFASPDLGVPRFPRDEWKYKPVGVRVTLDGEPINVLDGRYVVDGDIWLIVPRGDVELWHALQRRESHHWIEWSATSRCSGMRAEFMTIAGISSPHGRGVDVHLRRIRPNLRVEELYPALGPDIATVRDETAAPEERLASAARLLELLPSGDRFDELRNEIHACLTGLPIWWCACERAVIRAGAAECTLLHDSEAGFEVRVTPTIRDHARMTEGAIAGYYSRAARRALPDDAKVSVQIMRLLDDPQKLP